MSYDPDYDRKRRQNIHEAQTNQAINEVEQQLSDPSVRGTDREQDLLRTREKLEHQNNRLRAKRHGNKRSGLESFGYLIVIAFLIIVLIVVGIQIF